MRLLVWHLPADGVAARVLHQPPPEQRARRVAVEYDSDLDIRSDGAFGPRRDLNPHREGVAYAPNFFGRDRGAAGNNRDDNGIGKLKISMPAFNGRTNPEVFLEWEMRMDQFFDSHNYTEENKVRATSIEFTDYALVWWN